MSGEDQWRETYDGWKLGNADDDAEREAEREEAREVAEEMAERRAELDREDEMFDREPWATKAVVVILYGLLVWLLWSLVWERRLEDAVAALVTLAALWVVTSPPATEGGEEDDV